MKYLRTDPSCAAGVLIPKRRAPKCVICGAVLWRSISKSYGVPMRNAKNERLGYVPTHRMMGAITKTHIHIGGKRCWNGQACENRSLKGTTS